MPVFAHTWWDQKVQELLGVCSICESLCLCVFAGMWGMCE